LRGWNIADEKRGEIVNYLDFDRQVVHQHNEQPQKGCADGKKGGERRWSRVRSSPDDTYFECSA
jgi:hypothetical protein